MSSKTISLQQIKAACHGCRDDFYNHPSWAKPGEGQSPSGQCWSLESARPVWRWAINMQTPMDRKENFRRVRVNSCYHGSGPYRDIYLKRLPAHLGGAWADKAEQKREEGAQ